jgi:hypothetical protein
MNLVESIERLMAPRGSNWCLRRKKDNSQRLPENTVKSVKRSLFNSTSIKLNCYIWSCFCKHSHFYVTQSTSKVGIQYFNYKKL